MERIVRQHRLDPGARGWIFNTAKKNFWRVPSWYLLEDLIQDGFVCYSVCNRKYPVSIKRPHFMSLVKVSYLNHIHDLAALKTNMSFEVMLPPDSEAWIKASPEEATFVTLLGQAPPELKKLLWVLLNGAHSVPRLQREDRTWETLNDWLCRLISVNPALVDMKQVFTEHFGVGEYKPLKGNLTCQLKKNL